MSLRFRKSKKIAPGVRLNISNKSIGLSFGVKGFRKSISSSGRTTTTVGIPGTGLSYTSQETNKSKKIEPEGLKNNSAKSNAPKKPFYQQTWFIIICVIIILAIIGATVGNSPA